MENALIDAEPAVRAEAARAAAQIASPAVLPALRKLLRDPVASVRREAVLAGHVPFRARESCWPPGVPAFLVYALATPLYFLQTRNMVAFMYQSADLRHVYLNVPHSAHPALSILRSDSPLKVRFAPDSPLEQRGF